MSSTNKTVQAVLDYVEPEAPQTGCAVVFDRFMSDPELQHIPVVLDRKPCGLVGRQEFLLVYARAFGKEIYGRKPISALMDAGPLVVNRDQSCELVYAQIASIKPSELLGGFVIVDGDRYLGVGSTAALMRVISDLTRARAEELERERRRAEAANQSKTQFLANMSHELRTPLNAIIGFADLMRQERFGAIDPPRYREYVEDVHASGVHLLGTINDILDMAKIESGRFELEEAEFHPAVMGADVIRMLTPAITEAGVELVVDVPRSLPAIRADERQCRQVLLNLLSNAIKFTPTGGEIRLAASVEGNGGMAISITDTGIGIPDEMVGKVIQPFVQVENTFSRTRDGTGLGLPLSKAMVEAHGGRLTIASKPGEGTCVCVSLPAGRIVGDPASQTASETASDTAA